MTLRIALAALVATGLALPGHAAPPLAPFSADLDALWDFGNPSASEQRFRAELAKWPSGDPQAMIVLTQIARTQGMQRNFGDAHATLDAVERRLDGAPSHVRVRYLLERGRAYNSSGQRERAVPLFAEALSLAECGGDEYYAVDAAHMLGIATPLSEQLGWSLKALALAEAATDSRAKGWNASLYNNIGWTYHDRGEYAKALDVWQKALAARKTMGNAGRTRVAQWTVARGLRSLGKLEEAEAMQRALLAELDRIGETDGFVYEELAEIALARGDAKAAQPWAAKAYATLSADPGFAAGEPKRLARLAETAAGKAPPP